MSRTTRTQTGREESQGLKKSDNVVAMVNIMNNYKQFRHMNASYWIPDKESIFFYSYNTEVFYFSRSCGLYFSFLEYKGVTTQKQITTFLRSNLFDSINGGKNIENAYKTALRWVRKHYKSGTRASVCMYDFYMLISVGSEYTRVSYDGKTLKKLN